VTSAVSDSASTERGCTEPVYVTSRHRFTSARLSPLRQSIYPLAPRPRRKINISRRGRGRVFPLVPAVCQYFRHEAAACDLTPRQQLQHATSLTSDKNNASMFCASVAVELFIRLQCKSVNDGGNFRKLSGARSNDCITLLLYTVTGLNQSS